MSLGGRTIPVKMAAAVGAVAVFMVLAALLPAWGREPVREIALVARHMAFFAEGDADTPNPTIEVRAGERVRIVLRNEDRGMRHDFAVPAVRVAMDLLEWDESGVLALEVPDAPGTYEYVCRPHAPLMRGIILVR